MSVVRRVAKRFGSSLLERYWPEIEHLSDGLGSAVSFKIPAFRYVADLKELFALARRWVITHEQYGPWVIVCTPTEIDLPCGRHLVVHRQGSLSPNFRIRWRSLICLLVTKDGQY